MAITFSKLAEAINVASGTSLATGSFTATPGDILTIWIFYSHGSATCTPSDSRGNTITENAGSPHTGTAGVQLRSYRMAVNTGGSGTISFTISSAAVNRGIMVVGANGPGIAYVTAGANSQATPGTGSNGVTTGNVTVPALPASLLAFSFNGGGVSAPNAGTGMTSVGTGWDAGGGALVRIAYKELNSTGTNNGTFTATNNSTHLSAAVVFSEAAPDPPATLSSGTPTGTVASVATVVVGASTDQTSGTLYAVVDTSANLSGVTAAQVKAGNKNNNTAALSSGSVSVSGASPRIYLTGLQPNTSYTYALCQNNTNGDSNVLTGTFTTHATGASGLWPTAVSSNGRWIEDQNGDPWFVCGDANVALHHIGNTDLADYLDGIAAHGMNAVWWKLCMPKLEDFLTNLSKDKNGNSPFTGTPWQSTPTHAYWDNMEYVVQQCAERGITCFLFPSWAGWTDDEGDRVAMEAASNGQMEDYGEYIGERFKHYPNVIWMNGGDRASPGATLVARWGAIATGIQSAGATQLWGLHGTRQVSKADYISAASMGSQPFDLCTMYGDGENCQDQAIEEYADDVGPLISYEMTYENENIDAGEGTQVTHDRLRYQYWGAFCAGGVGHVFGNRPRYAMDLLEAFQVSGMTWESTLNDPSGDDDKGTLDFAKYCDFMANLDPSWVDMVPDTSDTFLTSGEGTGTTRAAARFNGSGTEGLLAVAYLPNGGSSSLTFDLTEFAPSAVKISKLDPVSGSTTEIGVFATSGSQAVSSLGTNTDGDDDWVLLFEAQGTSIPVIRHHYMVMKRVS